MDTSSFEESYRPVVVSLESLKTGSVSFSELEEAFGPESLGIILVKDLPLEFVQQRKIVLSYSSYLANLPQEVLATLESPQSKWLVGWSCGKEKLKDGRFDTFKGSYYINCAPDFEDQITQAKISSLFPEFPQYTARNVWPPESQLPGFEPAFRELCKLIVDTAALVARACDHFAEAHLQDYKAGYLEQVVRTSVSTKARLLHYFPPALSSSGSSRVKSEDDDWCATHRDHGALTGLTSAMFVDEAEHPPKLKGDFSPLPELDQSPDPEAGLYIHSRKGKIVKILIPKDCLAFQTGEALEAITEGQFRAVPHFVKGPSTNNGSTAARNTLAVFTQPNLWDMVDGERNFATFARDIIDRNH